MNEIIKTNIVVFTYFRYHAVKRYVSYMEKLTRNVLLMISTFIIYLEEVELIGHDTYKGHDAAN
jgi:hypothetical protein